MPLSETAARCPSAKSRESAWKPQSTLIDDLLALFGGPTQPVMAHLVESGKLTLEDVKEAEQMLRKLEKQAGKESKSK